MFVSSSRGGPGVELLLLLLLHLKQVSISEKKIKKELKMVGDVHLIGEGGRDEDGEEEETHHHHFTTH